MAHQKPTESELEILQFLWEQEEATVKEINDAQNLSKKVGYTTTLKIMQIMLEKGLLDRRESGRSHIYFPAIKKENTQKDLIERFVDTAFSGSAMSMVMSALGNHKASKEELKAIKELIHKLEKE
ncbi:Predicted transcriptional regulator [Spirosomataceae bacterium TFI 002]|nr:Predicted transcriptional regulator [Spirosomataceae bacterium TFI 002]